jgi:RNA polymerase-binding transcription factor DksA
VEERTVLRRALLDKGQELAELLAAVLAGRQEPSALDLLDAEPGETEEERLRRYLGLVQSRLDALAAGSYGRCERCGAELTFAELREVPWATRCRACAAAPTG